VSSSQLDASSTLINDIEFLKKKIFFGFVVFVTRFEHLQRTERECKFSIEVPGKKSLQTLMPMKSLQTLKCPYIMAQIEPSSANMIRSKTQKKNPLPLLSPRKKTK